MFTVGKYLNNYCHKFDIRLALPCEYNDQIMTTTKTYF